MAKSVPAPIQQLRKLIKGLTVGMLTTQTADGGVRSRPMLVQDVDENGWLWFLTDRTSRKACELDRNPHTAVVFQSPHGDRYVSAHRTAVVVHDYLELKRVWNPTYRAWFPKGRRDPEIVLIAVRVERVDYWLVPRSRLSRVVGAAKALVTRKRYEAGAHGTLQLVMG